MAPRPEPSGSSMTAADLAKAMEGLTLLNQSGRLQQIVQEIEHHDGSFTHAPQTHESGRDTPVQRGTHLRSMPLIAPSHCFASCSTRL